MRTKILSLILILCLVGIIWAATGDETLVLTSSVERRNQEPHIKPVWEHVVTATYDSDDTGNVTLALPLNGILRKIVLVVPNTTNAITTQIQINDNANQTVFDSGEQAENATYTFNLDEPLTGTIDIVIGVSGAVGTSGSSIVAYLRGI